MNQKNTNTISWFEIPVTNIARATKFYERLLGVKMELTEMQGWKMAIFPGREKNNELLVHGALVQGDTYEPSEKGSLVYFNGGNDLNTVLKKVEDCGGTVVRKKFAIGEHGHIAIFKDTEGNRVAFHSPN